jgi:hypothetical protein
MLYPAKCYWPGVTEAVLKPVAAHAAWTDAGSARDGVAYLSAPVFDEDDLVLCTFEGPSGIAVKHAAEHAGSADRPLTETSAPIEITVPCRG